MFFSYEISVWKIEGNGLMRIIELFSIIQYRTVNSYEPFIADEQRINRILGNIFRFALDFLFRTHFKNTVYKNVNTSVYYVLTSSTTLRMNVKCFSFYVIIFPYPCYFRNYDVKILKNGKQKIGRGYCLC